MAALSQRLTDLPVAAHLIRTGMLSPTECEAFEQELVCADDDLGGCCPLDAERLRSMEAVTAYGLWLYVLVRKLMPEVVMETGVQNGCSTELILWGMHRNAKGKLYSIDSGPTSSDGSHADRWNTTEDGVPGKNVLEGLKGRWELEIGLSKDLLLRRCYLLGEVDMFWHDSDHSNDNVQFEFETAALFVRPGGLLCMHDYHGQETRLSGPEYELVVPEKEPLLRVWRKRSAAGGIER